MLGIEDPQIVLAYVLLIGSAAACIAYGWIKRNEAD
ncbi:MAG: symporter small accessory protein [Methanomassiliicoccaceae archaeon]